MATIYRASPIHFVQKGFTLASRLCRALRQAGTSPPQEAKTLDGKAILRIAFGPAAPQAAVSTLGGLYYMDPFVEGVQPSKHHFVGLPHHSNLLLSAGTA